MLISSCSSSTNNSAPNVIVIVTDDQGYGDIAAHGNPIVKTPHLDQLHSESVRLTNYHVDPTCAPTRAALMTGRYATSTGVWHTIGGCSLLREDETTMADIFGDNGYRTGGFGKWHLGDNYPFRPFDRGFQHTVMHGGGGVQQTPDYWDNDYFDDVYFKNGEPQQYQGYCTDVFFDEAIDFIKSSDDTPFFCYIATNAAHSPYNVPLEYANIYAEVPDSKITQAQRHFYGMITNIDDNIGRLRSNLTDLNLADNTIIIFMADNGTAEGYRNNEGITRGFNAGMRGTKASQYDGGHRVPFYIHWKDGELSTGKDINTLAAHIDVLPTLANLCRLKINEEKLVMDGSDLTAVIKKNKPLKRTLIIDSQRIQHPEKWKRCSVMDDRWRLIDGTELYDIIADPGQRNDVAKKHPKIVAALRESYDLWWDNVSTKFDEEVHIPIGTSHENPVTLTAHDWHAENGEHPWNQEQIRKGFLGKARNGYWSVAIETAGNYKISISRYPIESKLTINALTPKVSTKQLPGLLNDVPAGVDMQLASGWVMVNGEKIAEADINESMPQLTFDTKLTKGTAQLKAGFQTSHNEEVGAYYVYVEKV